MISNLVNIAPDFCLLVHKIITFLLAIRQSCSLFAENLLLTADHRTVKLADFGLAREESLTEMMTAETGTYRWMAPEVLFLEFKILFLFWSVL